MTNHSKAFLLDGLRHEQSQCVRFIAEAKRNPQIKEGGDLEWALKSAVETFRALRDDQIAYADAVTRYCEIARVTSAYDTAAYMALVFTPYTPNTVAAIALRDELLRDRKDAA